ncbi:MAG: [acyl-carrier-protein] S-malonyltransferase [Planctomycetes bacterium]|jgi:[acyl-carrier-protein] S-malonyltransferase|nr:[acyl-carrier-protein] S-malonyltransferase [Planctomycetota bacterium]MDP6410565.1 ACP S-malonyltransferase [Planctomycetota bacterium]
MTAAILFPGQGAQFEGMGRDWSEADEAARETFAEADRILGFSLSKACWEGGDEVNRTDLAQPGIFTTSVAAVRALEGRGLDRARAAATCGLSLGEYSALWCAGSLDFADGLRLVRLRGEAMQAASEATPSGMVSLLGADESSAQALATVGAGRGVCSVANLNAPGQIILSGELDALDAVEAVASDHGVRRTRRLVVAGGFHSECMRPAAERLEAALREIELRPPTVPFYSNVTAEATDDPARIAAQLADQVCSPVLWQRSIQALLDAGVSEFLEPAPGRVLAGLMKKIAPSARVDSAATPAPRGA